MPVCVLRPFMDIMDEDLFEDDDAFPELRFDDEDDESELPFYSTPRVSWGDMFEALSGEKASPVRPAREVYVFRGHITYLEE